ncbi:MAG TPA: thiamine pyrophosphate-dependent enzyme, partial [Labilithrix sp.]|nr:thiamine pyrophosphate-dependent enzyme [Labilithrix sp.]
PRDVNELEVGEVPSWWPATLEELAAPLAANDTDVRLLLRAIRNAHKPVLILGTGADRCSDAEAIRSFAINAQVPVVTTMASSGSFPHDHPLYLGTVGAAGHPSAHAYLNEEADLLVAVGTGLNVLTRHPLSSALQRAKVVAVNVDAGELRRTVDPAIVVEADAGVVFRSLSSLWKEKPFVVGAPSGYALTRYRPKLVEEAKPSSEARVEGVEASTGSLLQSDAIELLEAYLPESGHLLFDAGNCAAAAIHGLTVPRGVTTTIALGMGGMGYSIAGAIGAQLGDDARRRTVVVCGDGAFLMLGFEIHTAIELKLPILFVVFNNNKHGMCVTRQKLFFEGRVECAEYAGVDVAAATRGLGDEKRLWIGRASTRAELTQVLAEYDALDFAGPGVLELCLLREEEPPFSPFLKADAETYVVRTSGLARRDRPAA